MYLLPIVLVHRPIFAHTFDTIGPYLFANICHNIPPMTMFSFKLININCFQSESSTKSRCKIFFRHLLWCPKIVIYFSGSLISNMSIECMQNGLVVPGSLVSPFQVQCQFKSSTILLKSSGLHVSVSSEGVIISNEIVIPVASSARIDYVEPQSLLINSTFSIFGSGFLTDMFAVVCSARTRCWIASNSQASCIFISFIQPGNCSLYLSFNGVKASNIIQLSILSNTISVHPSVIPSNIGSTITITGTALEMISSIEFGGKVVEHKFSETSQQITSFITSYVGQHVLRGYCGIIIQLQLDVVVRPEPHVFSVLPAQVAIDSHVLLTLNGIHFDSCVDFQVVFRKLCSRIFSDSDTDVSNNSIRNFT